MRAGRFSTARSTTPPGSRGSWCSRNPSAACGRRPSARSCSRRSRPSRRGCSARAIYVENPLFPLAQTAGVINLDGLHVGGRTRDVVIYGAGNSELEEMVRAAALLQGRVTVPDPHPERGLYYTSDQLSFALHGVPALFVKAGIDDSARGPQWGRGAARGLLRAPLPPAGRQVFRGLGRTRRSRGSGALSGSRRALGGYAPLSAVVSVERIQREPRAPAAEQ